MGNKINLTIGVIITLALAISGTYYLSDNDQAYYCESKDLVMVCEKLSSGVGTRCYYDDTYKICKEGWERIKIEQEVTNKAITPSTPGIKWECSPIGCLRIE